MSWLIEKLTGKTNVELPYYDLTGHEIGLMFDYNDIFCAADY